FGNPPLFLVTLVRFSLKYPPRSIHVRIQLIEQPSRSTPLANCLSKRVMDFLQGRRVVRFCHHALQDPLVVFFIHAACSRGEMRFINVFLQSGSRCMNSLLVSFDRALTKLPLPQRFPMLVGGPFGTAPAFRGALRGGIEIPCGSHFGTALQCLLFSQRSCQLQ